MLSDSIKCYLDYDAEISKDIDTPYKAFINEIVYDDSNDSWLFMHGEAVLAVIKNDYCIFERSTLISR